MATKLTDPASIDLLISEMTVAEKARLVIGGSPWCTEELPEYGIPKLFMLDSCNGLNLMEYESEFVYRDLEKQATAAGTPLDREKNGYMGGLLLALGALHKKAPSKRLPGCRKGKTLRNISAGDRLRLYVGSGTRQKDQCGHGTGDGKLRHR